VAIANASDGDIVLVPGGNCTWTAPVTIVSKAISVIGQGIDQTVIIDGTGASWGQTPFWVKGIEGKNFRISGFTMKAGEIADANGLLFIEGSSKQFRIDNCKFIIGISRAIRIQGFTYGLIDNCVFLAPNNGSVQGITIVGDGDAAWERPLTLGSANAVYVEDCTFEYSFLNDGVLDAYNGARYVFRNNKVSGTNIGHHGMDSGGYRSTHSFEIYNNTFTTSFTIFRGAGSRGGTGVYFQNTWNGPYQASIHLTYYRSCCSRPTDCSNWGRCDGSNPLDTNSDPTGYPCMDQPGITTGQVLSPTYSWDNLTNGVPSKIVLNDVFGCSGPSMLDHVKENRDYYNNIKKPDYNPFVYPHPLRGGLGSPSNLHIAS